MTTPTPTTPVHVSVFDYGAGNLHSLVKALEAGGATVRIDTYPNVTWRGTVESLSPATGAEFAILPAQNASGNWVKVAQRVPVRIRVEPRDDAPPLRAGLSAHVRVDTGHRRRLADLLP